MSKYDKKCVSVHLITNQIKQQHIVNHISCYSQLWRPTRKQPPSVKDGCHGAEIEPSCFSTKRGSASCSAMGKWRGLRVAFIVGSLFMILMIIVYWDDVGGFSLYPQQDTKHFQVRPLPGGSLTTPGLVSQPTSNHSSPGFYRPSDPLSPLADSKASSPLHSEPGRGSERLPHEDGHGGEDGEGEEEEKGSRQEERKQRILDVCSGKTSGDFPGRTRAFEQIPNRELDHLIVDDTHQIIYCYVPKVLCVCVCVCVCACV